MKLVKHTYCLLATLLGLFCISCVEENENNYSPQTYNVSGKVEKGPFVSGSAITIQPMSADMQALGTMYTSTIQDIWVIFRSVLSCLNRPMPNWQQMDTSSMKLLGHFLWAHYIFGLSLTCRKTRQ